MKIAAKLYVSIGAVVVVAFTVFGVYLYSLLKSEIDSSYQESMKEYLNNYAKIVDLEVEAKKNCQSLAIKVANNYLKSLGAITETSEQVTIGDFSVNRWLINGKQIQGHFEIVDHIQSLGIKASTIFQRTDKGYLRVSTNVLTTDGKRAIGTTIGFDSPVVQAIERGETYIGRAWVVNTWFITAYEPIRINGVVKGILFTGEPEIDYEELSNYFKEKQYFGSGYPYIVDNNGIVTAHPKSVGLSIADYDFFREIQEKKDGRINYLWEERMKTQLFNYIESIDSYVTVGWYDEDYEAIFNKVLMVVIFSIIIALAVVLSVLFFIARKISQSLQKGVEAAESIAKGIIDVDLETDAKDETGQLLNSMKAMANSIKNLVAEMNTVEKALVEGKLHVRGNTSSFEGEFKSIVNGYNATMDAVISPLKVSAEFINRISKGDIPPIITEEYKGDFNEIKNSLNVCIDAINLLIQDSKYLAESAINGKLDIRADATKHQGDFRAIIQGVNNTLDNIIGPLNLAAEYVDRISKGNIPPRITEEYKGDFNEIKNNLNNSIDNLDLLRKDIRTLSIAALEGKLDVRADITQHQGVYERIVNGFNETFDSVTRPLNLATEYVDRISKGEIPPKIIDEYQGDYNIIRNNLNGCIDGLQGLVEAREILANVVINNYTQDVTGKYLGIFADIANSANAILTKLRGITDLSKDIANGDLKEIDSLRKEGKRCEVDELNPSLLAMMETIRDLVEETVYLAQAGAEGKLEVRGNASKFKGEYVNVIDGFNRTMDSIINPLNEAGEVLSIYASGDLTSRMIGDYKGDMAVYKENINDLGESLSTVLKEVLDAVQATASAAVQISSTSETMAVSSEEQSKQADEVAGAVEEMARTVTENAMNAGKAAEVAEKNGEIANEGGLVVEQTVVKMRDIAGVVKQSAENIEKLGESSKQIGEIISVIDDIADQTNLLALNAAIEAARAGEQGRGFAVVADEVRKLAERTTEATKQIAVMIKGIQSETELAVTAMNQGTSEVADGITLADKAGASLKSVVDSSRLVQDMISQIAAASEQQSSTSEQIAKNVGTISLVTNDSARRIQDIAQSSDDLSRLTEQLRTLVSQFNVVAETESDSYSASASHQHLSSSKKHLLA